MNKGKFDVGKWQYKIVTSQSVFHSMYGLIKDDDVVTSYLASLPIMKWNEETLEMEKIVSDDGTHLLLKSAVHEDIMVARSFYKQQTIVYIATLLEVLLSEFLEAVFTNIPARMYDYLSNDDGKLKGKIDLNELLAAGSKEDLIASLATKASSVALQGKFTSALRALERITKCGLDGEVTNKLVECVERRNRIVHEDSQEKVLSQEIEATFNTLFQFLKALAGCAITMRLPINDPDDLG